MIHPFSVRQLAGDVRNTIRDRILRTDGTGVRTHAIDSVQVGVGTGE